MEDMVYALGADEFAMSFILVGRQDIAKRYLSAALGKIDAEEVKGRLLAAYNSLLARKLVHWSEEEQKVVLDGSLESAIEAIASPNTSIMATVIDGAGRENLAFHFGSGASVEVRDKGPTALDLRPLSGLEPARESIEALMAYPSALTGKRYNVTMTPAQIDDARKASIKKPDTVEGFLAGMGLDVESAQALASDLVHLDSRGAVMRMDYSGDVVKISKGLLTLKSPERCWMFKLQGDEDNPIVEGTVATSNELRDELTVLMS